MVSNSLAQPKPVPQVGPNEVLIKIEQGFRAARQIDTDLEDVGVAGERLRGQNAAV